MTRNQQVHISRKKRIAFLPLVLWMLFGLFPILVGAQDFHWSQFHLNPVYVNPAHAGFAQKKNRVTGIYRDQWRSVPVPYSTTHVSYDRNLYHHPEKGWRIGVGGHLLFDKAGDGAMTTFKPALSIAAGKYINQDKQLFQIGLHQAFSRQQIDFSKLKFDSQYDGTGYDPNLSHQEQVAGDRASFYDLGVGFNFFSQLKEAGGIDVGFSAYNLTRSSYTFLSAAEEKTSVRWLTYAKAQVSLGHSDWSFHSGVYYHYQNKAQETILQSIVGVDVGKVVDGKKWMQIQFGPGYRVGDAVIAYAGLQWKDLKVGFAFDGNTSSLRQATRGSGAYELALNYEWERKKKPEPETFEPPVIEEEKEEEEEIGVPELDFTQEFDDLEEEEVIEETIHLRSSVELYFANDQPHPKTRQSTSQVSYEQTFQQYVQELDKIHNDSSSLFAEEVVASFGTLEVMLMDIQQMLDKGVSLELEISGFASPLSNNSYNNLLSERRVHSVLLYLESWNNGALKSYLDSQQLQLLKRPFGDRQVQEGVSGSSKNLQQSIYSVEAARERRVELRVTSIER